MILLNIPALARPVRMPAKSSLATSIAFSIFSSASRRVSSITTAPSFVYGWCRGHSTDTSPRSPKGSCASAGRDQRADRLPRQRTGHVALALHAEHAHVHVVVAAHGQRGVVHDTEPVHERVGVGQVVELLGVRVAARVGVVDAVDAVLAHDDLLAVGLERPLHRDGVGREVRHAGARAEDDDAPLLEVPDRAQRDVRLGDLAHRDGCLHTRLDARLLQEVLQGQAVHHGAEHAHVVRAGAVHAGDAPLGAPEEVAATDDDGALHAVAHGDADLPRDTSHDVGVQPHAAAAERLARQLEQDAPGRLALRVHRHGLGRLVTHWSVTLRSSLPGLAPGRNTARPSGSPPPRGAQAADPASRSRVRRGTTAPRPTEDIETSPAPGWVPATGPPGWTARVQVGPARAEARTGPTGRRQEPTRKRTKEVSEPFTEATCLPTVTFGSLASGWSTSTTSLKKPF